jgi:hypothetical protein
MSVFTNPASGSKAHAEAYIEAVLALVDGDDPMAILRSTDVALRRAVEGLRPEVTARPEAPGKWSIRAVLRHMADSEVVWGWRLRMVLAHDAPEITGYDQDAWADRLGYAESDHIESLDEFAVLRRGTLRLLDRATPEDRKRFGVHSERGRESVEHMMRLYAGHDRLHLRQVERIRASVA